MLAGALRRSSDPREAAMAETRTETRQTRARLGGQVLGVSLLGVLALVTLVGALALRGSVAAQGRAAPLHAPAPEITGGPWINSAPLTVTALRGRVVVVEFWTYG
jgi:hypothetical protein